MRTRDAKGLALFVPEGKKAGASAAADGALRRGEAARPSAAAEGVPKKFLR